MNKLLAQAVRVFLANQRQGTQSALTRAEVNRTRKKLYKQKGTGGARHGDRKAPIFVGGGISFAPKPRDYRLELPSKMKAKSVEEALKVNKPEDLKLPEKFSGRTKDFAKILPNAKNCLVVTQGYQEKIWKAARNINGVTVLPKNQLNAYQILKADKVLMVK
ncbi:50S ribosomal protein L4 [Candidatus Microgenomates bacterium]|nr:50S ribosomal protein L4 [Candidatus Microgenomates bacterium]